MGSTQRRALRPHWLSFSTAQRRGKPFPATLSKALSRPCLVYPLASLDVSGQWPVSCADASPNEVFLCHDRVSSKDASVILPNHTPNMSFA